MKKIRLDQLIFDRGLSESREKAKATVMSGIVYVNGNKEDKPGAQVLPDCEIEIRGKTLPYVSRGGYKLEKALKVFNISPEGYTCIDCGASTGGFTDVLLQNGADKVYAIDVGYGQLAWKLRNDPRVINIERTNARYLSSEIIPEQVALAVTDVSFISIKLIIPVLKKFIRDDGAIVCLIKPQFEAGRDEIGKKGVVRDKNVHFSVINDILSFVATEDLHVCGLDYSPVKGPEGNIEFLLYLKNHPEDYTVPDIRALVDTAHTEL